MLITTNEIIEVDAKVCQCRRSLVFPDEMLYGAAMLPISFLKCRRDRTAATNVGET